MLLGARQFFERRGAPTPPLPYDAEVEYLESTGTQYIDTGIRSRDGLLVSSLFSYDIWDHVTKGVFGGGNLFTSVSFGFSTETTPPSTLIGLNTARANVGVDPASNSGRKIRVVIDTTGGQKSASIDGVVVKTFTTSSSAVGPANMLLFASYVGTMLQDGALCKVYSFTIKDTTTNALLLDLIPVRFTNELGQSEGAMYDRLGVGGMNPDGSPRTDGLYRNRGTGAFLWAEKQ